MATPERPSGGTPDAPRPRPSFFSGGRLASSPQEVEPSTATRRTTRPPGTFADPYEAQRGTPLDPAFGLQHIGIPFNQRPKGK